MHESEATVVIERPGRYTKQLASHLGHKITITEIPGGHHYVIENASADVLPQETHILFRCAATDVESLERMQYVLQKHLVKFAGDLNPEFVWVEKD